MFLSSQNTQHQENDPQAALQTYLYHLICLYKHNSLLLAVENKTNLFMGDHEIIQVTQSDKGSNMLLLLSIFFFCVSVCVCNPPTSALVFITPPIFSFFPPLPFLQFPIETCGLDKEVRPS